MKKSSVLLTVGIITGFITVVMLGLGIFTAAFLDDVLVSKAAEKTAMTNSSYAQWGQVPGSIGVNVTRKYTFFNFTNPFEFFWFNQTPTFTQMPGQLYQEFQNFTNPTYDSTDPDNGAMVDFGYQLMLHELNPSPLTVTTLNIGPLGFWNTAKNLPPYQIAFYGFVTLVLGLDANIITRIQAGGLMKTCLLSSDNIIQNILTPLGVTDSALQSFMVNDPVYGMGNVATLTQWVLAISQGPDSDSAYMIGNYFYLTYDQLTTLFGNTGDLATCLTEVNEIIQTKYTCASVPCDGNSLWLDQWTTQGVTNNPPNGYFTANASIASFNASIDGYAEISNFLTNYFLVNEKVNTSLYQGVVFDSDLAAQLLNVTPTPGNSHNVNTEPNTLANIANLAFIYGYGQAFDATNQIDDLTLLAPIANRFDLPSLQHAHVIWKYVQYFEQEFIVRQSKSGTTADLVAGQIFSTTLPMLFNLAQEGGNGLGVPQDLTSQILYKFIKGNSTTCQTLFTASASTVLTAAQITKICTASLFNGWNANSITDLYAACMRPNGPGYANVVGVGGLTAAELTTFCTTQGAGTYFAYASDAETYLKNAYGCAANFTTVTKCSNRELIVMQWTSSAITMNPPDLLKDKYSPALTLYSWYSSLVLFPFEYQVAIQSLGPNFNNDPAQMQPLPYYMANSLLTYDGLFNQVIIQRSFIAFNTQDWDWFKNVLFGVTPYNIISYIRFTTVQSAFEGFGQTKDAKDLLWGYTDLFLFLTYLQPIYSSGDPSIAFTIALAGKNCTGKKDTLFNGTMYTGVNDSSLTRQFYSVNGLSTITYPNTYFNGSDVTTQYDSPWKENIPLQGTDANINPPGISKDDTVSVYLSDINYIGELSYDSTQKYSGLEAYRFKLPKSALQNSTNNPSNDKWFSDRWDGLLNLTTLQKAPLFISKGHMLDVDPSLSSKFVVYNDSTQQFKVTPNSADDIYLDIEPYSGVAVGTMVRLQANLEIKPDSLFPNPNYYMLPVFLTERGMNFTSGQVQDTFGDLKTGVKFKHIGIPVFFALFAVFLAITIFVFVKRRSVMKRIVVNDASSPYHKFVEENSGHHHQSPPGQSGDESRVAHQDYAKEPYQQA